MESESSIVCCDLFGAGTSEGLNLYLRRMFDCPIAEGFDNRDSTPRKNHQPENSLRYRTDMRGK